MATKRKVAKETTKTKKRKKKKVSKASKAASGRRRPRPRTYSNKEHGKDTPSGPRGDFCVNPNSPTAVNLIRPPWDGGALWFRAFPALDPENPEKFQPIRYSENKYDLSEWIVKIPAVKYTGLDAQMTFHLYDPRIDGYDRRENPYIVCYDAIKQAVKKGRKSTGKKINPDWNQLVVQGFDQKMKPPTDIYYMQGMVYRLGAKVYVPPKSRPIGHPDRREDEPICVVQLSRSAGKRIRSLMNVRNEDWEGDEDDWEGAFKYNYFLDLTKGGFLCIFNPDKYSPEKGDIAGVAAEDLEEGDIEGEVEGDGDSDSDFKGWEVTVEDVLPALGKRYSAKVKPSIVHERWDWWFDAVFDDGEVQPGLLHFMSELEVVKKMATCFRSVSDALEYGLDSRHDLLYDDEVQAILKSRTSGAVPGADDEEDEDEQQPRRRRDPVVDVDDDEEDEEDDEEEGGDKTEDEEYEEEADEGEENEDDYFVDEEEVEDDSEEDEEDEEDDSEDDSEEPEDEEDEEDDSEEPEDEEEDDSEDDSEEPEDEDDSGEEEEDEEPDYEEEDEEPDYEGEEMEEPDEREKELNEALNKARERSQKRKQHKSKKSKKGKKAAPKPAAKGKASNKKKASKSRTKRKTTTTKKKTSSKTKKKAKKGTKRKKK